MKIYTRKQHIIEILGSFTSGCLKIPTREGVLTVDIADLAQAARRSLDVRDLSGDFLPRDAIIDEASVARGLTMFAYVYASLATASSSADPKLGFSTLLLDHLDALRLPPGVAQRLARSQILFVGDILSLGPGELDALVTGPQAAVIYEKARQHAGGGSAARWPQADMIAVPPTDPQRRARIMQNPIGKTELAPGIAKSVVSGGILTVGDLVGVCRAELMSRAEIGPLAILAIERMLAGVGCVLASVSAVPAPTTTVDA